MPPIAPTRRRFLQTSALAAGVLALPRMAFAADLTVGFIYVGPKDDYGYNQAHAEGAAAVKGIAGVTVVEEENVPETNAVQNTMQSMIEFDGASAPVPHLVRLLRPAHPRRGPELPRGAGSSTAAGCGTRGCRRTPAPTSAISAWAST